MADKIPVVIAIRNPHVIEAVAEEMQHMPKARGMAEAAEALIMESIRERAIKRAVAERTPATSAA